MTQLHTTAPSFDTATELLPTSWPFPPCNKEESCHLPSDVSAWIRLVASDDPLAELAIVGALVCVGLATFSGSTSFRIGLASRDENGSVAGVLHDYVHQPRRAFADIARDIARNMETAWSAECNFSASELVVGIAEPEYLPQVPLAIGFCRSDEQMFVRLGGSRRSQLCSWFTWFWCALEHLARQIAQVPSAPSGNLDTMPANQRERILEVNETTVEFRGDTSVVQVFTERAAQRPSAVALFGTERNYTWSELADQAARLAAWLAEGRDVRGQVVAVLADRNELSVVAFLGVAWAGAVYLPISAEFPTERIRAILADSGAVMAVSAGCDVPPDCAMTAWADIPLMNMTVSASVLRQPDDPLYVMYTSGSTGTPKGVVVSHRNVQRLVGPTSYVTWHENDRVALASTPAFDAMTFEMWGALLNGVPLACVPKSVLLEPDALELHLVHHAISVAFLSTAMFNYLAARRPQVFGRLRCVLFGGETAAEHLVQEVRRANPELQLHHVYGPTENTTFSTCYAVRGGEKRLPIGRPIGNSKAWVVDHAFRPLPVGAIGQLVVGGAGVAMGYHGRPDLTAERFVQANLSGSGVLHRIYLTGDLARWTPDFQIDFLGRSDHQVKIQGYRVELEEIRALMLHCSGITEVEILPGERTEEGFKSVYAYFCATRSISVSQLRAELAEVLPSYMVPSRLVQLASFPLTPQGKVDKAALDSIPVDSVATNARDSVDIRILAIWHELLQTNELSIDDHFSVVGGHSMLLLQLAHALYREFGVELSLSELIALPTVRSLADRLRPSQVGDEAFRLQPA